MSCLLPLLFPLEEAAASRVLSIGPRSAFEVSHRDQSPEPKRRDALQVQSQDKDGRSCSRLNIRGHTSSVLRPVMESSGSVFVFF